MQIYNYVLSSNVCTRVLVADIVILCLILTIGANDMSNIIVIVLLAVFGTKLVLMSLFIWRQPQSKKSITFKV